VLHHVRRVVVRVRARDRHQDAAARPRRVRRRAIFRSRRRHHPHARALRHDISQRIRQRVRLRHQRTVRRPRAARRRRRLGVRRLSRARSNRIPHPHPTVIPARRPARARRHRRARSSTIHRAHRASTRVDARDGAPMMMMLREGVRAVGSRRARARGRRRASRRASRRRHGAPREHRTGSSRARAAASEDGREGGASALEASRRASGFLHRYNIGTTTTNASRTVDG